MKPNTGTVMARNAESWGRFLRQPRSNRQLLTVAEVAGYLTLSKRTVYRLIDEGELQAIKVTEGGHYRVPLSSVAQFLTRRSTQVEKAS